MERMPPEAGCTNPMKARLLPMPGEKIFLKSFNDPSPGKHDTP
jgi:hypothetical protein